jgi:molecular chaperone GrpE (heat shock protein)
MFGDNVSSPPDEKALRPNDEGEVHAADEEHKYYPTTLEPVDDEEEDEERETLSSLASAIEQQSNYIKDLVAEIKNLRLELIGSKRRPRYSKATKNAKPAKRAMKGKR